jgi:hypothetical protein
LTIALCSTLATAALAQPGVRALPPAGNGAPALHRVQHADDRRPPESSRRGEWLRNHQSQSPREQEKALERDPAFRRLPPDNQERLRERLRDFNNRPPEQRQQMIDRMERWDRLTPQQRDRARAVFNQMRELPPDRQQAIRHTAQNLSVLPPQERERALNAPDLRSRFSAGERETLRSLLDLGAPVHGNAQH